MKTPGMTIVGAWTSPRVVKAAKPATAVMQTTRLPPTTAARRRASGPPRRQSVTAASRTNATRSRLPICGTIAHGLATPTGPETTTPPHSIIWSSAVTSRKLMFTPVTKFSAERQQPKARGRVGEPESSGVEVEVHEPDHRQHEHRERHVGPAQRGGVAGRRLAPASSPTRKRRRRSPRLRARRTADGRIAIFA